MKLQFEKFEKFNELPFELKEKIFSYTMDGPRFLKSVVNVIIRKRIVVRNKCFSDGDVNIFSLKTLFYYPTNKKSGNGAMICNSEPFSFLRK